VIFHAFLEGTNQPAAFSSLQNLSRVVVTGVCLNERSPEWGSSRPWEAKSFRLLLRSADDVKVLSKPPWLTLKKLLWGFGALGIIVPLSFAWVAVLRKRVQEQTNIIRRQLQAKADLQERYEDLFENANDMVFTHDLSGRITSMNRAGETLLQQSRDTIVGRNLLDLICEEERPQAAKWLQQVVSGSEAPTSEWNFVSASGNRLKLEINSRVVEHSASMVEVAGTARDITERKRLEKEILDISNREQRRIGHDLHDGVCQQLAAIAYRADMVADELREKNSAVSSAVEHLGKLVTDTIHQTRTVARGLFPVRLEENGLASALEELAANTGKFFKIDCRFQCDDELPALEHGAELHLYYIAQEAVVNAAKHGKARMVNVSLTRSGDGFVLSVQDDGPGFQPSAVNGTGMGVRIMRYRARVIGATLETQSQPGKGTTVTCAFSSGLKKHLT
jgi:PAS domain S-box-containing protein